MYFFFAKSTTDINLLEFESTEKFQNIDHKSILKFLLPTLLFSIVQKSKSNQFNTNVTIDDVEEMQKKNIFHISKKMLFEYEAIKVN